MRNSNEIKHVYILSTGRTGTQFLASYFDANFENVQAVHEPKPSYLLRIVSNAYATGKVSKSTAGKLFLALRKRLYSKVDADIYIESNPFLYGLADLLPEVMGNPVIIHMVRDPRDFVPSAINHGSAHGLKALVSRYIPYWTTRPFKLNSTPEGAVRYFVDHWVYVNQYLMQAGQSIDNYHCLKFESTVYGDHSGLKTICELLELDYPEHEAAHQPTQKVNISRHDNINKWSQWPDNHKEIVLEACGPLMKELGYSTEEYFRQS